MTNYRNIVIGQTTFFIGIFYMMITSYIIPPLIDVGNALASTAGWNPTEVEAITWLFTIIVFLFIAIFLPLNITYKGLTEKNNANLTPFMAIMISLTLSFLGILLTIKGWYMIVAINDVIDIQFIQIIFWIGLLINWIICIIGVPMITISQAYQTEGK